MRRRLPARSWLFVPGDSERKQEKALSSPADALILDLEDSVAAEQLPTARRRVAEVLHRSTPPYDTADSGTYVNLAFQHRLATEQNAALPALQ